jgi:hypothetical protein
MFLLFLFSLQVSDPSKAPFGCGQNISMLYMQALSAAYTFSICQSIGVSPFSSRKAFVLLNGLLPKKTSVC